MKRTVVTALAVFCILAPALSNLRPSQAATNDPESIYSEMRWRFIGPYSGGRVTAVAGVPSEPETFYAGAAGGGVWKTEDAGVSWKPLFDKEPVSTIGAIAIAPSDPKIIYVGTGEYDMRSSIVQGNGVYKSVDGGQTWTHLGLDDTQQIGRIAVDPQNPEIAYVAALGHPYAANTQRGVFRTTDGGKSWQKVLYKNADTGAIDLAIDPSDPKVIYASLWQVRRPPWSVYGAASGPGSGIYKSIDGGETWAHLTAGLPTQKVGKIGIALAPSLPTRLYAIIDAKEEGLYRSDDSGAHWKFVVKNFKEPGRTSPLVYNRGWYFNGITVDPENADTVYIDNFFLVKSTDGGKHFGVVPGWPGQQAIVDCHQSWVNPQAPDHLIVGCDRGALVTLDGGKRWSSRFTEPFGEFYRVATDNAFPYNIYGAQQDSWAVRIASRTDHGAIGLHDFWYAGGESGYTVPDPRNPDIFYDAPSRMNLSHGCAVCLSPAQNTPSLRYPKIYRSTWSLPVEFSKVHPNVMYYSQEVLFRTPDGGNTWQQISPDLTRRDPGVPPNLDAITAKDRDGGSNPRLGVIYSIGLSPIRAGVIWTGTDDGKVWVTRDEGKHWSDVTPAQLTSWSKVTRIAASAFDPATAYIAVDRHRLDDFRPYLYQTHDYGRTWRLTVSGIPANYFLNGIAEDPVQRGLLFAATERAVYASFNDGASWHDLRLNMPAVSVRDVTVHGDDVAIATHGRSFWVLDDITPLRAIARTQGALTKPTLFEPVVAYRVRTGQDIANWQFPDIPEGENIMDGALLDYYLPSAVPSVRVELRDGAGRLVANYTNARKHGQLAVTAGTHRFAWDLHYGVPPGVNPNRAGISAISEGPWAPPGEYRVQFSAAGVTSTQRLTLRSDPRDHLKNADLLAQFAFAQRVFALRRQAAALWQTASQRLKALSKGTQSAALRARLTAIVGVPQNDQVRGPATDPGSLRSVCDTLAQLAMAINTDDSAPYADWVVVFSEQQGAFATDAARYARLLEE